MKAVIIDDEENAVNVLRTLLRQFAPSIELVATASSAREGLEILEKQEPDIVFLDIEMPGMNGFAMLEQLEHYNFQVIFTTAYDHYAIKALKFSALDYLLKPVDAEELKIAVAKAIKKNQEHFSILNNFREALGNFRNSVNQPRKLALSTLEGISFIDLDEIIRLNSSGNYTYVHLSNGERPIASKTLKEFEELLVHQGFYRVHKSHLVNLQHVKKYIRGEGGTLIMSDNSEIDVSVRRKGELMNKLGFL